MAGLKTLKVSNIDGCFFAIGFLFIVPVSFGQNLNRDSSNINIPVNIPTNDTAIKKEATEKIKEKLSFVQDPVKLTKPAMPGNIKSHLPKYSIKKIINPSFQTKGNVSVGYEYGWLPFTTSGKSPAGNYRTEGKIEFEAFHLPFLFDFFYSDAKYNTGLNNHFKISYDVNAYKEEMKKKVAEQQTGLMNKVGGMLEKRQLLEQKLMYMENLKRQMEGEKDMNLNFDKSSIKTALPKISLPDTSGLMDKVKSMTPSLSLPDTSGLMDKAKSLIPSASLPSTDSLQNELTNQGASKKDSAIATAKARLPYDSVNTRINNYKKQLNEINSSVTEAKEKIEKLKNIAKNPVANNPFLSKKEKWLSGIQKFEIGLCYPSYSTFLVSNMPVKGINVQYERDDWFAAFTFGTTVNNLLFSTSPVQNSLQNARNLYNFFDFTAVEAGRRIAVVKTGWGTMAKTHLHLGFLYGTGLSSYVKPPENVTRLYGRERNTVVEVDAKFDINPRHSFELIYGKSAIKDLSFPVEELKNSMEQLLNGFRSNAVLFRYNGDVKKTKTKLTFTTRMVDPFFRSFGVAYMRSDNLRYELKGEQTISSKLKYTTNLRYDEDNLLELYQYKTRLYTWGNNIQWKAGKRTTIRLAYNPVLQKVKNGSVTVKNNNSITNLVVSYVPKTRNVSTQATGIYSYYNLTTDSERIHFQNVTFTEQMQFRNGFRSGITSSWYKNSFTDSLSNNTLINVIDGGYQFKNGSSFTIGGKMALYKMKELQGGYSLKGSFGLFKGVIMELEAEKLVTGEFYNTYNMQQGLNSFPYYFSGKIIYKW